MKQKYAQGATYKKMKATSSTSGVKKPKRPRQNQLVIDPPTMVIEGGSGKVRWER